MGTNVHVSDHYIRSDQAHLNSHALDNNTHGEHASQYNIKV